MQPFNLSAVLEMPWGLGHTLSYFFFLGTALISDRFGPQSSPVSPSKSTWGRSPPRPSSLFISNAYPGYLQTRQELGFTSC